MTAPLDLDFYDLVMDRVHEITAEGGYPPGELCAWVSPTNYRRLREKIVPGGRPYSPPEAAGSGELPGGAAICASPAVPDDKIWVVSKGGIPAGVEAYKHTAARQPPRHTGDHCGRCVYHQHNVVRKPNYCNLRNLEKGFVFTGLRQERCPEFAPPEIERILDKINGYRSGTFAYERGLDPWHRDAFPDEHKAVAPSQGSREQGWFMVDGHGNQVGFFPDSEVAKHADRG